MLPPGRPFTTVVTEDHPGEPPTGLGRLCVVDPAGRTAADLRDLPSAAHGLAHARRERREAT